MSRALKSLPYVPHRRYGKVFLLPGDDFVQQLARHLRELNREFRNFEAPILQNCLPHTFHQFWPHQGQQATMVYVVHIGSAYSELPPPSSNHTGIQQLAGDNIRAANLSQRCAITTEITRLKLHCITPSLFLRMDIPVRLVMPFLDMFGT